MLGKAHGRFRCAGHGLGNRGVDFRHGRAGRKIERGARDLPHAHHGLLAHGHKRRRQPLGRVFERAQAAAKFIEQPALAHARFAANQHKARLRVRHRLLETGQQQVEFALAAHKRADVALGRFQRAFHAKQRDGLGFAFERARLKLREAKARLDDPGRLFADIDGRGLGGGLHAVGRVHGIADSGVLAALADIADNDFARLDADAHAEFIFAAGVGGLGAALHFKCAIYGAIGVVAQRFGRAEKCEHGVAHEFVHVAAVARDHFGKLAEQAAHEFFHLLGVELFAQGGVILDVGEQHGNHAALARGLACAGGRRRERYAPAFGELGAALIAELRRVGILHGAGRASLGHVA